MNEFFYKVAISRAGNLHGVFPVNMLKGQKCKMEEQGGVLFLSRLSAVFNKPLWVSVILSRLRGASAFPVLWHSLLCCALPVFCMTWRARFWSVSGNLFCSGVSDRNSPALLLSCLYAFV